MRRGQEGRDLPNIIPQEYFMETKKWYESKLVWLGVLVALQGIIPLVIDLVQKGQFDATGFLTLLSGIILVVLRVITNDPILPIQK